MAKQKINRTPSPIAPTSQGENSGMAQRFMRDNPVGKLTDPPEIAEGREKPFAGDMLPVGGETPEAVLAETLGADASVESDKTSLAEGVAAERPGEAAAPPSTQVQAETPAEPKAESAPAQPAAPAAEAKPAQAETPSIAKLDREAKYELLPGHEWTGEQILAGLQQRAELEPKAQEADKFRTLLGGEYADAEGRWKPVLEKLAANPNRTQFLEEVLATEDPAAIDYLKNSLAYFKQETSGGASAQPTQSAAPAAPALASDPTIQHLMQVARDMEGQLAVQRANSEKAQLYSQYPFLQSNQKAREAIFARASEMYALDEKEGKPFSQRRGLLDAMEQQKLFLDSMAIAHANAAPPRVEPNPAVGAQRLLPGGGGPGASGAARPAPPREYRGDPDKARDKFLEDYPD